MKHWLLSLLLGLAVVGCASPVPTSSPSTPPSAATTVSVGPTPTSPAASTAPTLAASPPPPTATLSAEPRVECDPLLPIWTQALPGGSMLPAGRTLTCGAAIAAAADLVGPIQNIAYIEFGYFWYCPPGDFCAASQPNDGHVIFHLKGRGPDILVSVRADEAGKVRAIDLTPLGAKGSG